MCSKINIFRTHGVQRCLINSWLSVWLQLGSSPVQTAKLSSNLGDFLFLTPYKTTTYLNFFHNYILFCFRFVLPLSYKYQVFYKTEISYRKNEKHIIRFF